MADRESLLRWFASQRTAVSAIECLEISHPGLDQVYRICTAPGTTETPDAKTWYYAPILVKPPSQQQEMAYRVDVTLQDLNDDGTSNGLTATAADVVDQAMAYNDENAVDTPITCTFYAYLQYDDDTISGVVEGPYELYVVDANFTSQGVTFTAEPQLVNAAATGERATLARFPMIRQWLT